MAGNRHIEIEGALVNLVQREVVGSIPLPEWIARIERRNPTFTPVLPTTPTRGFWWDPTDIAHQRGMMLLEMQPTVITMDYQEESKHRLSIPWTRFVFYVRSDDPSNPLRWSLEDYRIFWARTKYSNPDALDMVPALLPNVYGDGRICFGSTGARADQSLADRLDETIAQFYVSTFNHDLTIHYPNGWRNWARWEKMTEEDPTGWMNWPDLNPTTTTRNKYSWASLAHEYMSGASHRDSPVLAADGIPELPIGATFGRIDQWFALLTNNQRVRLMAVGNQRQHDIPGDFVPTNDTVVEDPEF